MHSILIVISLLHFTALATGRPEEYPPPELLEFIEPLHETCTKKLGVTDEEVKNYQFSDNSEKMMCYMKCLMVEAKWGKEDGSISYDYIRENVHPKIKDIALDALEKCLNIEGEDCERAYNFNVCLQKADPAHYFLP